MIWENINYPSQWQRIWWMQSTEFSAGVSSDTALHNPIAMANSALSAYVMVNGEIRLTGTGKELLTNEEVRNAYLGGH